MGFKYVFIPASAGDDMQERMAELRLAVPGSVVLTVKELDYEIDVATLEEVSPPLFVMPAHPEF